MLEVLTEQFIQLAAKIVEKRFEFLQCLKTGQNQFIREYRET